MDTIETVVLMLRAMSAQCPTTLTGTTSPLKVTAIHLQVQQVIVQETIQETHTIMELATQSILVHAEGSITITAMDIRPTFQRETCGKDKVQARIGGIRKVALNSYLSHLTK